MASRATLQRESCLVAMSSRALWLVDLDRPWLALQWPLEKQQDAQLMIRGFKGAKRFRFDLLAECFKRTQQFDGTVSVPPKNGIVAVIDLVVIGIVHGSESTRK